MKKIAYIFIFITILSIVIATSHSKISLAGNEEISSVQTTTDKWSFSAHPFTGEGYESRPVMVTSVKTEIKTLTVTAVRVRNISSKSVTALKLGWYLINDKDKNTILQQGETQLIPIEKSLLSGKGELLSLPIASFTELQKPLIEKGKLEGAYKLIVSVSEIYFEDKTNWKPGQKIEIAKQSTEVK